MTSSKTSSSGAFRRSTLFFGNKAISIHYIPTENQLADIGTKFLKQQRLRFLINSIKNFGN